MTEKKTKEVNIEHPMEKVLDLEENSTSLVVADRQSNVVQAPSYDEKDEEIETQFQEVYDAAMEAFDTQMNDSMSIEPKYRARNQEIAVQFLNAALNAASHKSSMKQHKDKVTLDHAKNAGPKTLNQNLIVADRNEILKHLHGGGSNED